MKYTLKLEEAAQFAVSIYLFSTLSYAWWLFPALFLVPDLSMLGYFINTTIGAVCYNVAHHKGVAVVVGAAGMFLGIQWLLFAGILLYGHSAFDRMMGYGLKHTDGFKHTHLGML